MRVRNIDPIRQAQIVAKLEAILFPENIDKTLLLHDIDNNVELQTKIMDLSPEIKAEYYVHNRSGINRPNTLKRPWLSILKNLLKDKYKIIIEQCRLKQSDIRTKKYHFILKTT